MNTPDHQAQPPPPGWLRRKYRRWRGFPWRFCLAHPAAPFRGVMTGPFAGTRLSLRNSWSQAPNLLLGSYEKELHPVWEQLIGGLAGQSGSAWVIGAAEGYYVCGLAKRCPGWRLVAFETNESSRKVLRRNLRKNGVEDRVEVRAKCDLAQLHDRLRQEMPRLIVSDIEGGENEMFTEDVLRLLPQTALVIEVHPEYELLARLPMLELTHRVRLIEPAPRTTQDYPVEDGALPDRQLSWMDERRSVSTPWVIALPRGAA